MTTGLGEERVSAASVTTTKADPKNKRRLARKMSRYLGRDRGLEACCAESEGGLFVDYVCAPCSEDRKEIEPVLW